MDGAAEPTAVRKAKPYNGIWKNEKSPTPRRLAKWAQEWLDAVADIATTTGEEKLLWADGWREAWLPWASKNPVDWTKEDLDTGRKIYRLAHPDANTPLFDYGIAPDRLRVLSVIIVRRARREDVG
jgi:hypothetical protein